MKKINLELTNENVIRALGILSFFVLTIVLWKFHSMFPNVFIGHTHYYWHGQTTNYWTFNSAEGLLFYPIAFLSYFALWLLLSSKSANQENENKIKKWLIAKWKEGITLN